MDLSRDFPARFYDQYYSGQTGGSFILTHYRPQRGRGIFGKLFRGFVLPTLGKAAGVLKREAPKRLLSLGRDVIGDVVEGRSLGSSLKERGLSQLKQAAGDILAPHTSTPRRKKRKTTHRRAQVGGARRSRVRRRRKQRVGAYRQRKSTIRRGGRRRRRSTAPPLFSRGRDIFG